jgi:hypothetical protein
MAIIQPVGTKPTSCAEAALDELCDRYGYCVQAPEVEALVTDVPESAEAFLNSVLAAEGGNPDKREREELLGVIRDWLFDDGIGRGTKSGLPRLSSRD